MKNIEKTNFWDKNFILPIRDVITRFPLTIISFLALTIVSSFLIITETEPDKYMASFLMTLGTSGILFIAGRLFVEKFLQKIKTANWIYVIIFAYCVGFYFWGTFYLEYNFLLFVLQILGFIGFLFWISYSCKEKDDFAYYNFFRRALGSITIGFIVANIVSLLGFIAIMSVSSLFELNSTLSGKIVAIWSILSFAILGTTYALSRFPRYDEVEKQIFEEDKTSNFIVKYIFVPFSILYFVILYAYSLQVLINFNNWPKGIVANMVMGFSLLGYFTYILSKNLENTKLVKIFRKILPWAIFLQIFMLFYAIFLRINQYGLTTNRYIVAIVGVSLLGISLYYMFSSRKRLVIIPATFSVLALIFSIGPWNIRELPWNIQFERFKNNLIEIGALQDGKIVKIEEKNTKSEKIEEIRSQIYYLCGWNYCDQRFVDFVQPSFANTNQDQITIRGDLMDLLGISYIHAVSNSKNSIKYFYNNVADNIIDVSDYDIFIPNVYVTKHQETKKIIGDTTIEINNNEIILQKNDVEEKFSLKSIYNQLKDKNPPLSQNITFDIDGQSHKIRLIIYEISIDTKKEEINDMSFYILVK